MIQLPLEFVKIKNRFSLLLPLGEFRLSKTNGVSEDELKQRNKLKINQQENVGCTKEVVIIVQFMTWDENLTKARSLSGLLMP